MHSVDRPYLEPVDDEKALKSGYCAQYIKTAKKMARQGEKLRPLGAGAPSRDAVGIHDRFQLSFRLLAAPNTENRERSAEEGECADSQTGINLWNLVKCKSMSSGDCAECKTQNHE
jgi:hypothetical protein